MKCLTVCSIFAELIVSGAKTIENRPRPTPYRGPLLVHAGLRRAWGGRSCRAWADRFGVDPLALRPGHAIGVVDVVDCVSLAEVDPRDPHAIGPWCWILADARRLPSPIPMRGQLGLFSPADDVLAGVLARGNAYPRPINMRGAA